MILKGSQRGGAKNLALHLLKDENDHVRVHELRGFASENLVGALNEAYAISRGTKCQKFLYSLSLNPPQTERVSEEAFEAAITQAEDRLGLSGQPRAIVFHEKEGRRHAHAVWSRIDVQEMKAVHIAHDHRKLMALSRELYREHGWEVPKGLLDRSLRDPANFTLQEWQQARRAGQDPRTVKTAMQDAWASSDDAKSLKHALLDRGFVLAKGDRRGFIALDHKGTEFSLPRYAGVKTKDIRGRIAGEELPTLSHAKAQIAERMIPALERFRSELDESSRDARRKFTEQKTEIVEAQRAERKALGERQRRAEAQAAKERQARYRTGLIGLWDRLRGEHKRTRERNEREAAEAAKRQREERNQLVAQHLSARQQLKAMLCDQHQSYTKERTRLEQEREAYKVMRAKQREQRSGRDRGPSR